MIYGVHNLHTQVMNYISLVFHQFLVADNLSYEFEYVIIVLKYIVDDGLNITGIVIKSIWFKLITIGLIHVIHKLVVNHMLINYDRNNDINQ